MTAPVMVVVAPNFHLPSTPRPRLLVADGKGWREDEPSVPAPRSDPAAGLDRMALLFALPGHLHSSFWTMLEETRSEERFDTLAAEFERFMTFKQLPPPARAHFELVLYGAGGKIESCDLWAIVNLSDDPIVIGLPGLRVRLGPAHGCRLPEEIAVEVLPPDGGLPVVLLLVRRPTRVMEA
jgi:hypothetical protein